jgi:hypothetical protein
LIVERALLSAEMEYRDIVVDILATDDPKKYANPKAACTVAASDILFAKPLK